MFQQLANVSTIGVLAEKRMLKLVGVDCAQVDGHTKTQSHSRCHPTINVRRRVMGQVVTKSGVQCLVFPCIFLMCGWLGPCGTC